jgi:hypothetical protein
MSSSEVEIATPFGRVDRAMDAYIQWRNECIAVRDAYSHWAAARGTNVALAFQAYAVALDREELASERYAALIQPMNGAQHALAS